MTTYTINGSEVSGVIAADVGGGTSKRSNPERPTIALVTGSIAISGYRTQKRQSITIREGTTQVFSGWMQDERYDDITSVSTYRIEGLLNQAAKLKVSVVNSSITANADDAAVLNLMRDSFGLSAMQSSIRETPLTAYSYMGGAAGYASRFAAVSGGLPYMTLNGELGIKDPSLVPDTLDGTFDTSDYRIADIATEFDATQLWNRGVVSYRATEPYEQSYRVPSDNLVTSYSLPSLVSGAQYINVSMTAAGIDNPIFLALGTGGNDRSFLDDSTYTVYATYVTPPSDWTITNVQANGGSLTWDWNTPRTTPEIRVTARNSANAANDFSFTTTETFATQTVTNSGGITFTVTFRMRFWLNFSISATIQQPPESILVSNAESISEWDVRELTFPSLFRRSAESSVQARIDALAQQRNIHTVYFYTDQRDPTKTAEVAALQPGMFIGLPYVGKTVFVMYSQLRMNSAGSDMKILTCIEAEDIPILPLDNPIYIGSTSNPVYLGNTDNPIGVA